jgi:hypothetical protein
MSDKEDDECGTGARCGAKCEITKKQLSYARVLVNCEPFQDRERLDNWLQIMEEVVEDIGIVYRSSFCLLESNNFKDESLLGLLRALYIIAMAEVDVVKRMRT